MQFKNTKNKSGNDVVSKIDDLSDKFDKTQNITSEIQKSGKSNENADEKKNYTLFLSKKIMNDLEEYLKDFGMFGENKSLFVQEAIKESLKAKKQNMEKVLMEKLNRLKK